MAQFSETVDVNQDELRATASLCMEAGDPRPSESGNKGGHLRVIEAFCESKLVWSSAVHQGSKLKRQSRSSSCEKSAPRSEFHACMCPVS